MFGLSECIAFERFGSWLFSFHVVPTPVPSSRSMPRRILGKLVRHRTKRSRTRRVQIRLLQRQNASKHLRRRVRLQSHPVALPTIHGKSLPHRQGRGNESRPILQNTKFLLRPRLPRRSLRRTRPRKERAGEPLQPLPRNTGFDEGLAVPRSGVRGRRERHTEGDVHVRWRRRRHHIVGLPDARSFRGEEREAVVEGGRRLPRRSQKAFSFDGQLEGGHGLAGIHQGAKQVTRPPSLNQK